MTKLEAIAAMKEGKKVTHRYFTKDEWVTIKPDGKYHLEDGVKCKHFEFWQDRQDEAWNEDWEIVNS